LAVAYKYDRSAGKALKLVCYCGPFEQSLFFPPKQQMFCVFSFAVINNFIFPS